MKYAYILYKTGKFKKSREHCKFALEKFENNVALANANIIETYLLHAVLYIHGLSFTKAKNLFTKIIKYYEPRDTCIILIKAYYYLGILNLVLNEYPKAKDNLEKAYASCKIILGQDSLYCGLSLCQLAQCHLSDGKVPEAEHFLLKGINIIQIHLRKTDPDYILANIYLAEVDAILGRKEKSLKNLNKYLQRAKDNLKSDHYVVGKGFAGLGKVCHSMKNYENALSFYNEAVTIFRKHENKLEVADTLHRIGNLLVETRDCDGAIKSFEQALEIKNNFIGPTSRTSLVTKLSIITNYFKRTGSPDSREAFKEILLEFDRESFPSAII